MNQTATTVLVTRNARVALELVYDLREIDPSNHKLTGIQLTLESLLFSVETADSDNPICASCGQVIADHDEARETTEGWACGRSCGIALTGQDSA